MQAATTTLRWLVGCRNFFVNNVTQDSGSSRSRSSDSAPKAPKRGNSKLGMPFSADGKTSSSSTINVSADATGGLQTLKQGPAKSSKKKSSKQTKKKGPESASNQTRAAGDEAAKIVEKEREEEQRP